jgi:hypothetical protein
MHAILIPESSGGTHIQVRLPHAAIGNLNGPQEARKNLFFNQLSMRHQN